MSFTIDVGGDNIVFPSPDFGDQVRVDNNSLKRFTVNRRVVSSAPFIAITTYRYQFSRVKQAVINSFKTYLDDNQGQELDITDHKGVTRTGFIQNPTVEISVTRPTCSYAVEFDFLVKP